MNTISINEQSFTAPQKWEEMDLYRLIDWTKIVQKQISRTDAFALAVITFYKLKPKLYFAMQPAQHVQLKDTLSFLAEENLLNKWLIPSVNVFPLKKYYGPEDYLSTSTIKEFRFCELFYHQYQKTKDAAFLDKLIGTLFRPKGKSEVDKREKLSRLNLARNAERLKSLSPVLKNAILFNYEGCRNAIFKAYPKVFKPSGKGEKSNTIPDLENIINVVAGGKFGNFAETEETLIYRFLDHLTNEITENEKRQTNATKR